MVYHNSYSNSLHVLGRHIWQAWHNTQTYPHWQHTRLYSKADIQRPAGQPASPETSLPGQRDIVEVVKKKKEKHVVDLIVNDLSMHIFYLQVTYFCYIATLTYI